jgi:hypothetical protein
VQLSEEQSRELFKRFRVYASEICDRCGKVLGLSPRFTLPNDARAWCSRECRDGNEAHDPGTCRNCGASLNLKGRARTAIFYNEQCAKQYQRFTRKQLRKRLPRATPRAVVEPNRNGENENVHSNGTNSQQN